MKHRTTPVTIKTSTCEQCKHPRRIASNRKICSGCRRFNGEINRGLIRTPDYEGVTTEGYKEPMQAVEDGFGYYGAITRTTDGKHIQCHMCGYYFANLAAHVHYKHQIKVRDYKTTYGLRITAGLVSPHERQAEQRRFNEKIRAQAGKNAQIARVALAKRRAEPDYQPAPKWSAQMRNEEGRCRDQTIARIRHVADLNEGRPSFNAYTRVFGGGAMGTVKYWFGSWNAAVIAAGYEPASSVRIRTRNQRVELALIGMRDFYEKHGRTPQTADFRASPSLPHPNFVAKEFGSLNEARREAGVPLLIRRGRSFKEVAA